VVQAISRHDFLGETRGVVRDADFCDFADA